LGGALTLAGVVTAQTGARIARPAH
jgi:hypothetical protein